MLIQIEGWLEYMKEQLDKEVFDLVELSEIEQVYEIIETKE
jgi:hypothetical protein